MKRQTLGSSQITVTSLGLGLAALGRPGYINLGHGDDLNHKHSIGSLEARAHAVLDVAWAAGIRYYDAARSYGRAEMFLGSWLAARAIEPAAATIGSKWGYTYTAEWQVSLPEGRPHEIKDHSLPVLKRQIEESRALLGVHLDLYQIHSATVDSGVLTNEPVLKRLAALRSEGLAIGLSVSGPQQAETIWRALEISFDGRLLFSAVQATWNMLEQSAGGALTAAHQAGLGVIIKEALANGRLTSKNNDPDFRRPLASLQAAAERHGATVDALALAAALSRPFASVTLSGAARTDHLRSNVKALDITWDDSLEALLPGLVEPAKSYWQTRSSLPWN